MLLWLPGLQRRLLLVPLLAACALLASGPAGAGEPDLLTVNLLTDEPDAIPGDGKCDVSADSDAADCTLRAAFEEANAGGLPVTINFDFENLPAVISPGSALPELTVPALLDASALASEEGQPGVVIDGSAAGDANGLVFSGESTGDPQDLGAEPTNGALSLRVTLFSGHGVVFSDTDGGHLLDSVIGAPDAEGTGNSGFGVYVAAADHVKLAGNAVVGNGAGGVFLEGAVRTRVGLAEEGRGNVISGNEGPGIHILGGSDNFIASSTIGLDADGDQTLPNSGPGVLVEESSFNVVGMPLFHQEAYFYPERHLGQRRRGRAHPRGRLL